MAYFRVGNGGSITETTLWTNSAPTSDFSEQDITLSQTLSTTNFDEIRYVCRHSKTIGTEFSTTMKVSDFTTKAIYGTFPQWGMTVYIRANSGAKGNVRVLFYKDGTTLHVGKGITVDGTGQVASMLIPVKIVGIKYS